MIFQGFLQLQKTQILVIILITGCGHFHGNVICPVLCARQARCEHKTRQCPNYLQVGDLCLPPVVATLHKLQRHACVCVYTRMCSWRGSGAGLIFSQINPVIWLNIQPDRCYCWQAERGGMSMWGGKSSRGKVGPCFWWQCKHKTVELH